MAKLLSSEAARSLTKTDAAYLTLRSAIEDGELKPGERLRIARLEERLGMSPTPIREALRLLQADGLVAYESHRGMVVAEYSQDQVREIYSLRGILEPYATKLAAERASNEELAEIRRIHSEYLKAVSRSSPGREAPALNAAWHEAIYAVSGSRYLQDFVARLWLTVPAQAVWRSTHAKGSAAEHDEITRALEARNGELAAELMRRHIEEGAVMHDDRLRRPGGASS